MLALQSQTTEGSTTMADMTRTPPPGILGAAEVARIWTQEARKQYGRRVAARTRLNAERTARGLKPMPEIPPFREIKPETVLDYLRNSQPGPPAGQPRRYAKHPLPAPSGRFGRMPWWPAHLEQQLRDWYNNRPGLGHGTGGWPAGRPRRKSTAS